LIRPLLALGCLVLIRLPGLAAQVPESGKSAPASPPADSALRAELLQLRDADQRDRDDFGVRAAANDTLFIQQMLTGDSARTRRLIRIIQQHGWPTRALVGEDGTGAAFLLLQHSPSDSLRSALLPEVWRAAERGDLKPSEAAMLTDKVRLAAGKPQLYGTSFELVEGRLRPHPIEGVEGLEARRAKVGLPPMAEYARVLAEVYKLPVDWPPKPAGK
jgi:hypothetical protein